MTGAPDRWAAWPRGKPYAWAALAGCPIFFLLWPVSAPPTWILFSDFYQAYYEVGERLLRQGAVPTWPLGDICTEGFVNIPALGWLFAPLALLSKPVAAWVFLALGVASVASAFLLLLRLCKPEPAQGALLLFLFIVNGPIIHGFREGNTTEFVLPLLIAALMLARSGSQFAAGLVLGFCGIMKLPLLLFGVFFALQRRWRLTAGFATATGAIVALSLAVFGFGINVGWYQSCLGPFLGNVMPGFNVQSLDAFIFRLAHGEQFLHTWYLIEPSQAHRMLRTVVLAAAFTATFLLTRRVAAEKAQTPAGRAFDQRDLLDYVLVLTLALVASPLSWAHYYQWLLLPWGLYLAGKLPLPDDAATRWLMGGSMVLSSLPVLVVPQDMGWAAPVVSRTLVSAWFLGGMLALVALARGAAREARLHERWVAMRTASAGSFARMLQRAALSPSEALTRNLLAVLFINVCLVNAVLWAAAPAGRETTLAHTWDFVLGNHDDDSWGPMAHALEYFEMEYFGPPYSKPFYTELVFERAEKFQYPPSSLFLLAGTRMLDELSGTEFATDMLSWLLVALTAVAAAALLENRLRLAYPPAARDSLAWLRAALIICLSLTFYPVVKAYTLGQVQAWINALFAFSLYSWATGRHALAGLLIGFATLIKPHYGLLLLWGVIRSGWSFVLAGGTTVALGGALSLYVFGWDNHLDYLRLLSHLSERGEAFYPNQSINGLLNRLMSITDPIHYNNLDWVDGYFPPFTQWVYMVTLVSSVALLAAALLRRRRGDDADGVLDFCTVAVSITLAAPIAWEHHYGILLPVFAVLLPAMLDDRRLVWLGVGFLLASNYIAATQLLAATPFNVLQSYLLVAGFVVLMLLHVRPSAKARVVTYPAPATLSPSPSRIGAG